MHKFHEIMRCTQLSRNSSQTETVWNEKDFLCKYFNVPKALFTSHKNKEYKDSVKACNWETEMEN